MLLNVEHLYKYFNGQALLKDINFTVEDREAVGLIGINGCGKSTLGKSICKLIEPTDGSIVLAVRATTRPLKD